MCSDIPADVLQAVSTLQGVWRLFLGTGGAAPASIADFVPCKFGALQRARFARMHNFRKQTICGLIGFPSETLWAPGCPCVSPGCSLGALRVSTRGFHSMVPTTRLPKQRLSRQVSTARFPHQCVHSKVRTSILSIAWLPQHGFHSSVAIASLLKQVLQQGFHSRCSQQTFHLWFCTMLFTARFPQGGFHSKGSTVENP